MASNDETEITRARIIVLREEHRDLDQAILRLEGVQPVDELQLRRLKKRKLLLRDQLTHLEGTLIPDIPA